MACEGTKLDFVHHPDRPRGVIHRGGVKNPGGELEAAMHNHPQVVEAAAIGNPDGRLAERNCGVVVLGPGGSSDLESLTGDLEVQELPHFMPPERLEIVDSPRRNAAGKVLKRTLAGQLQARGQTRAG